MARLVRFPDAVAHAEALAALAAERLADALAVRDRASLVCAGGATPAPAYERLSLYPLDWRRVEVTGSDERWLEPADPDSIDHLLHAHLFKGPAAAARFVPLKTADAEPEVAEAGVDARVAAMPRPFDLTLLGMGADGHTASLFPGAAGLGRAMDLSRPSLVAAVRPREAAGSSLRMSLSLKAILASRLIVLAFRGKEKLKVYETALANPDPTRWPVSAVLAQKATEVQTWWAP